MGLIIDTSAIVAIERRKVEASTFLAEYASESVAIPVIVWAELLAGVRLAKSAEIAAHRRSRLEQIRLHVPFIEFDAAIAEHYADIFTECIKAGTPIPQNDIAVAATARHLAYRVLVSADGEQHFCRVKDLDIVTLPPADAIGSV